MLAGGALHERRTRLLVALAPLLFYWQANAPVTDFVAAVSTPSTSASYYAPLLAELRARGVGGSAAPARIEVVPTASHWEARWVAPSVMIARGWERQLDRYRNGLFYDESRPLTAARYRAWLDEQGISYVALPDAELDYSAKAEARLLRGQSPGGAPSYLHEVFRSAHWRLFAVVPTPALAQQPATLTSVTHDSFTLATPRAGTFEVRLRFTPYWAIAQGHGCVARAPDGWTQVRASAPGSVHVVIRFSLARVFEHGPRCS